MDFNYDWAASLACFAGLVITSLVGRAILFRIPAFKQTLDVNVAENKRKWDEQGQKYRHRVKSSKQIGFVFNTIFYVAILPFLASFTPQPIWKILLDAVVILMVYDLLYYLVHRYLFHGNGYFRRVHAVHHQARSRVSSVDSHLLHPMEIFIGIALYFLAISLLGILGMAPFHVASIIISTVIYVELNQMNHCRIDLDGFPYRLINWIAMKHDAHHINMHKGNFATITLLYDKLFGTYEMHPRESADSQGGTSTPQSA